MPTHNFIDLTGQPFGRLTVLERVENTTPGRPRWRCQCSCGNIVDINGHELKSGGTKSCGCWNRERLLQQVVDLTNQPFGRLTVIKRVKQTTPKKSRWQCRCSCGNIVNVNGNSLKSKNTQSCGCLKKELELIRPITHGMSKSREYIIWTHMLSRCLNPKNKNFKNYGGRGITICDEWRHDFMTFYNYVGKRPTPKHTIERINNDLGYMPGNVCWALMQAQNENSRNCHYITLYGWTMTLSNWARFVGIKLGTLSTRIHKRHWPPAKAIFQKVKRYLPQPRGNNNIVSTTEDCSRSR